MSDHVGQAVVDGELRWYRSVDSPEGCIEEDGSGFPPEEIRTRLLHEEGTWRLTVESAADRVQLARTLRELLALPLAEAAVMIHDIPGVVYTGTRVEAEWVRTHLAHEGARLSVARAI